jgi:putative flippase GtrA
MEKRDEGYRVYRYVSLWKRFLNEKEHRGVQFIKYALSGGISAGVDMVVFFLLAWSVLPALTEADWLVRMLGLDPVPVTEAVRSRNFVLASVICFFFSNLTAYILNLLFVFKGGRHARHVEFTLFYGVSVVSLVLAVFAGWVLIAGFGLSTTWSYIAKMAAALLINYAGRRHFIFHQ